MSNSGVIEYIIGFKNGTEKRWVFVVDNENVAKAKRKEFFEAMRRNASYGNQKTIELDDTTIVVFRNIDYVRIFTRSQ